MARLVLCFLDFATRRGEGGILAPNGKSSFNAGKTPTIRVLIRVGLGGWPTFSGANAIRSDELIGSTLQGRVPSSLRHGRVSGEEDSAQEKVEPGAVESKMDAVVWATRPVAALEDTP